MSFIEAYPRRGEMDEWKPGMDDEATPDPDGVPFLPDADDVPAEEKDDEKILDHDPDDWFDPHWEEHAVAVPARTAVAVKVIRAVAARVSTAVAVMLPKRVRPTTSPTLTT